MTDKKIEITVAVKKDFVQAYLSSNSILCECSFESVHKISLSSGLMSLAIELGTTLRPENLKTRGAEFSKTFRLIPALMWRRLELFNPLQYKFFEIVFKFSPSCTNHRLLDSDSYSWIGNSLSARNYPFILDPYNNALSALRGPRYQIYIWSTLVPALSTQTNTITSAVEFLQKNTNTIFANQWPGTILFRLREAAILRGKFLLMGDTQLNLELNQCHEYQENIGDELMKLDKPNTSHQENRISLFIDANLNLYHYVSESLRPLAIAIDNHIEIHDIFIRNGLPEHYYELIDLIYPDAKITRLGWNEKLEATDLYAGICVRNLSSNDDNFYSEGNSLEFLHSDEMRLWKIIHRKLNPTPISTKNIYISRKKGDSRGIWNAHKIENKLREWNFDVIEGEKDKDYLRRVAHTSLLCSSDGAGMANMIFIPEGSNVIELKYQRDGWKNMAIALNLNHSSIQLTPLGWGRVRTILDNYYLRKAELRQLHQKANFRDGSQ